MGDGIYDFGDFHIGTQINIDQRLLSTKAGIILSKYKLIPVGQTIGRKVAVAKKGFHAIRCL